MHVTSVTTWHRNRLNHDIDIQKLNWWDLRRCADWDIQGRRNAQLVYFEAPSRRRTTFVRPWGEFNVTIVAVVLGRVI